MNPLFILFFLFIPAAAIPQVPVLVDRIAVIVSKQVIKLTEVDRDLRVTAFLNQQHIDSSAAARRKAADRLVDQLIIRQEMSAEGYQRPSDADADQLLKQITSQRFQNSTAQLRTALARYGLTETLLHEQLLWQLTVLRFIDERFRPGILVNDDDIKAYHDEHLAELKRDYPKDFSLETLSPKIKTTIEGQRIDQAFDSWLAAVRKRTRIEFKEAAFQ
jgi:hypothetical protein